MLEELPAWQSRPLDRVYPVVFIDAIHVKIRDGKVANRPVYTVVGVTVDGERDILGLWVGDGGEGAKYWHQVLTEIMNRGTVDVCIVVCDGLRGLPEAIADVWPLAIVQTCVLHLIRNTFRYASQADWDQLARDLRPVYTAPTEQRARIASRARRQVGRALPGDRQALAERWPSSSRSSPTAPRSEKSSTRRMRLSIVGRCSLWLPVGDQHLVGAFGVFDERAFLVA